MTASPFDNAGLLPDGSPAPRFDMSNVRRAQHQLAIAAETTSAIANTLVEERRLAEANQRHAEIMRAEAEMNFLRAQQRAAARQRGDDFHDRMHTAFIDAVRREAEAAGLPFQEPVEEVIEAPKPIDLTRSNGPSIDGAELSNLRQRFEKAVLGQ